MVYAEERRKYVIITKNQDGAVDSGVSLDSVLRMCKVLATRLDNDEFKEWVDNELTGYALNEDLPHYRRIATPSYGDFFDYDTSNDIELEIRKQNVDKKYWNDCFRINFKRSVPEIQYLIEKSETIHLSYSWKEEILSLIDEDLFEGKKCDRAWRLLNIRKLIYALNEIRCKILDFILEFESQIPDADEIDLRGGDKMETKEKVTQIIHNHFHGNIGNVVSGSHSFTQNNAIEQDDPEVFQKMLSMVKEITNKKIAQAAEIHIKEMQKTYKTVSFKEQYISFMSFFADHVTALTSIAPSLGKLTNLL